MSMEAINQFYEKVRKDADLQNQLMKMDAKTLDQAMESVVTVANESGFEITRDELMAYLESVKASAEKNRELDDAELDSVAGGGRGEWIAYSIASFGIFCAASAVGKIFDTCALDHPETLDHDWSM